MSVKIELYESSGFGRDKGETHHPHRSPVIQPTPTAYWNTTNSVVTMETSGRLVTSLNYVITKSNGEVVISGTCISKPDEPVTITLPALAIGKYTLNITIGIITYTGNFYVF